MDQIEKEYEELQKKYNLPPFKEFNKEFEIVALELDKCGIFLNAITRVVHAKIKHYLSFIDPFLAPQPTSTYTMVIFKELDDTFRKNSLKFYKELMIEYQNGHLVLLGSDKEKVQYINNIWNKNKQYKKEMQSMLKKLNKIVLKDENKSNTAGYLG
jgi:hypothetical protein